MCTGGTHGDQDLAEEFCFLYDITEVHDCPREDESVEPLGSLLLCSVLDRIGMCTAIVRIY